LYDPCEPKREGGKMLKTEARLESARDKSKEGVGGRDIGREGLIQTEGAKLRRGKTKRTGV